MNDDKRKTTMLFAKYGKLEHLEMLANGNVFFNPIEKYRGDTTSYRGDENEGMIPIDASSMKLYDKDGNNIFEKIPRPTTVKQSYVGDDSLLIFCASMITQRVLSWDGEHFLLTDKYKESMNGFGDYVLLFHSAEFLESLHEARKNSSPEFAYTYGPIIYRNLDDFSSSEDYLNSYRVKNSYYDPYFVKSRHYEQQNEWRLIVDGTNGNLPTKTDGSYMINIDKMKWAYIFEVSTFFNDHVLDFLKD